jgi:tRNA G18 (ribose-2'-O)-methylase SpoU
VSRGYVGVGIFEAKTPENVGGLWRSAHAFGADFIFTVGPRYPRRQVTDTTHAERSIPLFTFATVAGMMSAFPRAAALIGIECGEDCVAEPTSLPRFSHPPQAVYLLGAEDRGLSREAQGHCHELVSIPTALCLNVASAGTVILYDRAMKEANRGA